MQSVVRLATQTHGIGMNHDSKRLVRLVQVKIDYVHLKTITGVGQNFKNLER